MILLCLLALLAESGAAWAGEVSVSARLSDVTAAVGEQVELQITVQGTQNAKAPQVRVEGLSIQYVGPSSSSSFQFQNGRMEGTSRITHTYTVLPQKDGTFTIPALAIEVDGKKLATEPLTLTVSAQAGGGNPAGGTANAQAGKQQLTVAEWVVPKTRVYVGEAVPVELRLYVDSRVKWRPLQIPQASGEGFTLHKMVLPKQWENSITEVTRDGHAFDMLVFRTAITPVKDGKLTLPATDIPIVAVVQQKRQRPRMPQMPGMPDMDALFNQMSMNVEQQVAVRSNSIEFEALPLPSGKPKDFSGAVGQFTLETKAAPERVRAGDPVTVTAVVKGVGSFDRMQAPVIASEPGWKAYPPSGKFTADDEVGISGEKTFETALIPETAQTELPRISFSFFNPSTEKYETLPGKRIPIVVEGAAAPASTPGTSAAAASATPAASPAATPIPKANDIQYIRVDAGRWKVDFAPVWSQRGFWLVQLVPLAALLGLGGWQWRRLRLGDGAARRLARLRQAKAEAGRVLRDKKTPTGAFFDAAIRVFQLEAALGDRRGELEPETVDAETACASRTLDCETAEGVRRVFAMHGELRYAGAGAGGASGEVHPDQRERVLQILEQFEKSHA